MGDPRLRLISVANQGVSAARNLGVAESQAPFIAFLDADDRWRPEKLSRHLEHLASDPELGVSFDRVEFLTLHRLSHGSVLPIAADPPGPRALSLRESHHHHLHLGRETGRVRAGGRIPAAD